MLYIINHIKWKLILLSTHFNNYVLGALLFNFYFGSAHPLTPLGKYCQKNVHFKYYEAS